MVKTRLSDQRVDRIRDAISSRDNDRCTICGALGAQVHELLFRSSGAKNSRRVFVPKFMACLCLEHHTQLHTSNKKREMTLRILEILKIRYSYTYTKSEMEDLFVRKGK